MSSKQRLSLQDFARTSRQAERRKTCSVCALPEEVQTELRTARKLKIPRQTVLAWLHTLGYRQVTDPALDVHVRGLHESR